jgi:hypothetical protein
LQLEKRQKEFVCGVSWRHVLHAIAQLAIIWRQESKKKSRSGSELLDGQQQSSPPALCIKLSLIKML